MEKSARQEYERGVNFTDEARWAWAQGVTDALLAMYYPRYDPLADDWDFRIRVYNRVIEHYRMIRGEPVEAEVE